MLNQQTFTDIEYAQRKRAGKREKFLDTMNGIIPWTAFVETIEPFYPKSGQRGQQPKGIELMLRMYFLQIWFNLGDEALEENIYDSYAFRKFMRLDYFGEDVPDATTLLRFRHLLEEYHLQKELFETLKGLLERSGKMIREDDSFVNGDAGYTGIENREEIKNDERLSKVEYRINKRKDADKKRHDAIMGKPMDHLDYMAQPEWDKHFEYMKSKVRCKVEHVFAVIKKKFGYRKAAYRGLQKNLARLYMLFCSANMLRWSWSLA